MRGLFVRFLPFILITGFVGVIFTAAFFVIKYPFTLRAFQSKSQLTPHPFVLKTPQAKTQLTPAVTSLTGTWSGSATFKTTEDKDHYCTYTGSLTLRITQSGNNLNGRFSYTASKAKSHDSGCDTGWTDSSNIATTISGSRIGTFNVSNGYGSFSGSVTGDTITLNQNGGSFRMSGSANLLRQR